MAKLSHFPAPWWRQLGLLRKDFLSYLCEAAKLGPAVLLRPLPFFKIVLVNDPALIEEILVNKASAFAKSKQTKMMLRKFLGDGLITSTGFRNLLMRKTLAKEFAGDFASKLNHIATGLCEESFEALSGDVDLKDTCSKLSLDIFTQVFLGEHTQHRERIEATMKHFAATLARRFRSMPMPDWLPTKRHREDRRMVRELQDLVAFLTEREDDEYSGVLRALNQQVRAGQLSKAQVSEEIATLLFAGHETTAKLLTWTLYELAKQPELVHRYRSMDARDQSHWLDALIQESLRLYPPVWVFDRSPLKNLQLGSLRLKAGQVIYFSPFAMHRNEAFHVDPLAFKPERFLDRSYLQQRSRFAFFPFGAGARVCPGQLPAWTVARSVVAYVMSNYDVVLSSNRGLEMEPLATLEPKGSIPVRMSKKPSLRYEPRSQRPVLEEVVQP